MNSSQIRNLGVPDYALGKAQRLCGVAASQDYSKKEMKEAIKKAAYEKDTSLPIFGEVAEKIIEWENSDPREEPKDFPIWGENIDENAIKQLVDATKLPPAIDAALMPDAHLGYGVPVGSVLATDNAIIPSAVGVDIACRMKCTITDIPTGKLKGEEERFVNAIREETRFGMGSHFDEYNQRHHEVLDRDWSFARIVKGQREKACSQLGSSGGGNHFVEFGIIEIEDDDDLDIEVGTYLAIMSHSGSRGPGACVANHYSNLAQELHPELDRDDMSPDLKKLAWLDMDSPEGQEYWKAMNLMADFAEACHEVIHKTILSNLGAKSLGEVQNHHNLCWREGDTFIHRKGATPAKEGQLGIIPGTMGDPAYLVRGKGNEDALESASHGAGRRMSRGEAHRTLTKTETDQYLREAGVKLISGGLDESPLAYKDIHEVMDHQKDLVDTIGKFYPKIVKMADD